jgi:hypothetical protein
MIRRLLIFLGLCPDCRKAYMTLCDDKWCRKCGRLVK